MIKNFLKGFIIGIGKIMPGISGSMLAISLNVYEKLLEIIADIKNITWEKFKFLSSILLGALLSISSFSSSVKWLLNNFYFPIMLLFIGLIIGGMPDIIKELEIKNIKFKHIIIFIISFTLSYILTNLNSLDILKNQNSITYFILGLIEAFSSLVPGISGTAIYISLGCYEMLLDFFSNIFSPQNNLFTIFFTLGILVGIIIIAKTITYLLKKYKTITYYAILGFMTSAILIMIKEATKTMFKEPFNGLILSKLLIGIFIIYLGYKITIKINNLLSNS